MAVNHYQRDCLFTRIAELMDECRLLDFMLLCQDRAIMVHKLVMIAHSPYIDNFLRKAKAPCLAISLDVLNIEFDALTAVIGFLYKGKIDVSKCGMEDFMHAARALQLDTRGISESIQILAGNDPESVSRLENDGFTGSESNIVTPIVCVADMDTMKDAQSFVTLASSSLTNVQDHVSSHSKTSHVYSDLHEMTIDSEQVFLQVETDAMLSVTSDGLHKTSDLECETVELDTSDRAPLTDETHAADNSWQLTPPSVSEQTSQPWCSVYLSENDETSDCSSMAKENSVDSDEDDGDMDPVAASDKPQPVTQKILLCDSSDIVLDQTSGEETEVKVVYEMEICNAEEKTCATKPSENSVSVDPDVTRMDPHVTRVDPDVTSSALLQNLQQSCHDALQYSGSEARNVIFVKDCTSSSTENNQQSVTSPDYQAVSLLLNFKEHDRNLSVMYSDSPQSSKTQQVIMQPANKAQEESDNLDNLSGNYWVENTGSKVKVTRRSGQELHIESVQALESLDLEIEPISGPEVEISSLGLHSQSSLSLVGEMKPVNDENGDVRDGDDDSDIDAGSSVSMPSQVQANVLLLASTAPAKKTLKVRLPALKVRRNSSEVKGGEEVDSDAMKAHSQGTSPSPFMEGVTILNLHDEKYKDMWKKVDGYYQCLKCDWKRRDQDIFMAHLRRYTGDMKYKCNTCQKGYSRSRLMKEHLLKHQGTRPYKCALCDKEIGSYRGLTKHINSHTRSVTHMCQWCGRVATDRSNLQKHILNKHKKESMAVCTVPRCVYSSPNIENVIVHLDEKHASSLPSDTLDYCKWLVRAQVELYQRKNVVCFRCNFTTNSLRGLLSHLRATHNILQDGSPIVTKYTPINQDNAEAGFQCTQCSFIGSTAKIVGEHFVNAHQGSIVGEFSHKLVGRLSIGQSDAGLWIFEGEDHEAADTKHRIINWQPMMIEEQKVNPDIEHILRKYRPLKSKPQTELRLLTVSKHQAEDELAVQNLISVVENLDDGDQGVKGEEQIISDALIDEIVVNEESVSVTDVVNADSIVAANQKTHIKVIPSDRTTSVLNTLETEMDVDGATDDTVEDAAEDNTNDGGSIKIIRIVPSERTRSVSQAWETPQNHPFDTGKSPADDVSLNESSSCTLDERNFCKIIMLQSEQVVTPKIPVPKVRVYTPVFCKEKQPDGRKRGRKKRKIVHNDKQASSTSRIKIRPSIGGDTSGAVKTVEPISAEGDNNGPSMSELSGRRKRKMSRRLSERQQSIAKSTDCRISSDMNIPEENITSNTEKVIRKEQAELVPDNTANDANEDTMTISDFSTLRKVHVKMKSTATNNSENNEDQLKSVKTGLLLDGKRNIRLIPVNKADVEYIEKSDTQGDIVTSSTQTGTIDLSDTESLVRDEMTGMVFKMRKSPNKLTPHRQTDMLIQREPLLHTLSNELQVSPDRLLIGLVEIPVSSTENCEKYSECISINSSKKSPQFKGKIITEIMKKKSNLQSNAPKKQLLERHMTENKQQLLYQPISHKYLPLLREQSNCKSNSLEAEYRCDRCPYVSDDKQDLCIHKQLLHDKCQVCLQLLPF